MPSGSIATPSGGHWAPGAAILALLAALALGSGCTEAVVGGGATAAVAASEERGLGGALTDTRIRAEINYNWLDHDKEMFAALALSIYEGRVMITGIARTEEARAKAVELAWQADGVKEVINEIVVDPAGRSGTFARDTWISTQLRSELLFDKEIDSINYTIETVRGTVYLIGVAQSEAELRRVIDHARNLEYVEKVVNHVLVKDDPRRTGADKGTKS